MPWVKFKNTEMSIDNRLIVRKGKRYRVVTRPERIVNYSNTNLYIETEIPGSYMILEDQEQIDQYIEKYVIKQGFDN